MPFAFSDIPDQSGKTAIVTGANAGIGFEIARHLALRGAQVVLACRSADKAGRAMDAIKQEKSDALVRFLPLDLGNLDSVRAAATEAQRLDRIDLLVNNAGIIAADLQLLMDGVESQFAVNHLGHFALTALLYDRLQEEGGARVVTQSSIAHRRAQIDLTNLDGAKGYDRWRFYGQSKLANLLFALELDRRLRAAGSPVASMACHPGIAASDLFRALKGASVIGPVARTVLNTSERGALPALQAATDPNAKGGDYYGPYGFREMRGRQSGRAMIMNRAKEKPAAANLWERSEELTGIDFPIG